LHYKIYYAAKRLVIAFIFLHARNLNLFKFLEIIQITKGGAMKIYNAKNSKIIVLTQHNGANCPRIKFIGSSALLRDDYNGEVKSKLLELSAYLF